ncbi:MAG: alpha/beta fold hydrolase [Lutibacter sp.]|uniref:alpha/beta fold hydrolase n=1 Tax=Lutibacter sp. TaxID=1925666 RepID=UPI0017EA5B3B|nr:alpha/beta fold hydrolase [Lutibacter sp.]MBT8317748.1 alpha/beta fold hydrolase [Lutibacter sp.]NNJ58606.1 alpha/beta fold hydrolase [Lutibacter sp.]
MYVLHKNTKVYFSSIGTGSAVVLLHGFLENSSMWNSIAKTLSKKYKVICIDLLGHGKTENHGYIHTMEDQAEMIKTVLNHLRLRKYVLIGHSMGGYVALAFSLLFPLNVKGLCLMNSTALPDSEEKKLHRDRAIEAVKQSPKTFVRIAIPMLFSETNREQLKIAIEKVTEEALKIKPHGIIAALEGMKIRKDQTSIYKTANFPIQLIIGKQDSALDYNSLIQQTSNTKVEVVEFPDGHMSHLENKNELIETLTSFIKTCY